MNEIKISVIVPIYNTENYVDKCIKSILSSILKEIEIILIDDGSTDNSGKKCDEWEAKDKRIKVIHQENKGLGEARNVGIKNATGKYIAFIDSDDRISNNFLSELYLAAEENNSDICICNYFIINLENKEITPWKYFKDLEPKNLSKEEVISNLLSIRIAAWNKLYKTSFIKNFSFITEKVLFEDIPYQTETLYRAKIITYIDNYGYYYNTKRPGAITHKTSKKNFDMLKIMKMCEDLLKKYNLYDTLEEQFKSLLKEQLVFTYKRIPNNLKKSYIKGTKNMWPKYYKEIIKDFPSSNIFSRIIRKINL